MSCINCQWSERIDGRNEMVGCNYDMSLHNAEDCCISYLPITKTVHPVVVRGKKGNMMKLNETAEMMNSEDYKERFKAEYMQLVIRYRGLKSMLEKWDKSELSFSPTCPRSTYNMQITAMTDYIAVLEARAVMEDVNLDM